MTKKFIFISLAFAVLFLIPGIRPAFAQGRINPNLPGMPSNCTGPNCVCDYVFSFYTFALMIGGILAVGAIVYGGVKYTMAAGNPSGQSDGKEWIKGALLGLLLLISVYLILNVINPQLTKCNLMLSPLQNLTPGSGYNWGGGTGPTGANCSGVACATGETECYSCSDPATGGVTPQCGPPNQQSPNCADTGPASGGAAQPNVWQCPTQNYNCYWANNGETQASCDNACGTACLACPADSCTDGTNCSLTASPFPNCTPTALNLGNCAGYGCTPSAQLNSFIYGSCLPPGFQNSITATTGGQHTCNVTTGAVSCHFGGKTCTDGGHAVDFGWNSGLKNSYPTLAAALQALQNANCPNVTAARCEFQGGAADPSCSGLNHIHVNIGSCGCP